MGLTFLKGSDVFGLMDWRQLAANGSQLTGKTGTWIAVLILSARHNTGQKEKEMKKGKIRKMMKLKKGGRMQISSHGAGMFSIQVIRGGKVRENMDLPDRVIREAGLRA